MDRALDDLRAVPTEKRIRATVGDRTVLDTTRAAIVWEPRRVVPSYAVPVRDLQAELVPAGPAPPAAGAGAEGVPLGDRLVLDPTIPFAVHTADGEALSVRVDGGTLEAAAFRSDDPALEGLVILDFAAFDAWFEEDERNVGHPRDPFHRIDTLRSSRTVRIEVDGALLAESSRPQLLFETSLPMRAYLPREDVRVPLEPGDRRTFCAYKGQASYWTPVVGDRRYANLAWSYEEPLREAAQVRSHIAFFDEHVDVTIDGEPRSRPRTPWS
jgi:uncharacterized protein (DUF427 family)